MVIETVRAQTNGEGFITSQARAHTSNSTTLEVENLNVEETKHVGEFDRM